MTADDSTSTPECDENVYLAFLKDLDAAADPEKLVEEYAGRYPHLVDELRAMAGMRRALDRSSQPEEDAEPPPDRLGDFRIVRRIAHGGMGEIYEAIQEPLQPPGRGQGHPRPPPALDRSAPAPVPPRAERAGAVAPHPHRADPLSGRRGAAPVFRHVLHRRRRLAPRGPHGTAPRVVERKRPNSDPDARRAGRRGPIPPERRSRRVRRGQGRGQRPCKGDGRKRLRRCRSAFPG